MYIVYTKHNIYSLNIDNVTTTIYMATKCIFRSMYSCDICTTLHCCIFVFFCRRESVEAVVRSSHEKVLIQFWCWCRAFFPFYEMKKKRWTSKENAVSMDICGNWYKLCYELFLKKVGKKYLSSNDSISLKIFSVATVFFIVADAASAVAAAAEVIRFLVWVFQSHHKMAVTFLTFDSLSLTRL